MSKPQTINELAKELGYCTRHVRDIAKEMVDKGEWVIVKVPDPEHLINAYMRKSKKKWTPTKPRT